MQKQLAIKIAVVLLLGLALMIPVTMVKSKVYERSKFLEQAKLSVAKSWTGKQVIVSPFLIIPYKESDIEEGIKTGETNRLKNQKRQKIVIPDQLSGTTEVKNKSVYKGIYEVPVYNSEIVFHGSFSSEKLAEAIKQIRAQPSFETIGQAYIALYISVMRGLGGEAKFLINGENVHINPGTLLNDLSDGLHSLIPLEQGPEKEFSFDFSMSLRGMESLSFVAIADDSNLKVASDWPHPEFLGASLPENRNISESGFTADWVSSRFSNNHQHNIDECIHNHRCKPLMNAAVEVAFIESVDVYLQSERLVKYAMLFIGLSFITFFIFEQLKKVRIHPIQYCFVGLVVAIFYLLLISLAEHIAFHFAYLLSVFCCSSLLLFYVRYVLKKFAASALFSGMVVTLYGLLYIIVQAEDFAMLMGAGLVFCTLAILMIVTRKIDWYDFQVGQE